MSRSVTHSDLFPHKDHSLTMRLVEQKEPMRRRGFSFVQPYKSWLPFIFMLSSVILGFVCLRVYNDKDSEVRATRKELLGSLCDQRARILEDRFITSVDHAHALAELVSTFHHFKNPSAIDAATFADYTASTAFERTLLSGVSYAERVLDSEREEFERLHGWKIKTMAREPSPAREEYAPVIFFQETVSFLKSLDMMSGEEDRENILRSRALGKAVLTRPFRLLGSHHLGVVLTFPVYKSKLPPNPTVAQRIEATGGYLGGAFDVEALVETLLSQFDETHAIMVHVYDVTNISTPLIMYGVRTQDGDPSLSHESLLDFGDPFRKHKMICRYREKTPISWQATSHSFFIFVIFFLVIYIIYSAAVHILKVEEDFCLMEKLKLRAESADDAKSKFLATVSHEIRTPMNGILGMLSLLLDTELSSAQQDYAQTAQACGKGLITLINEVLDREKIEAGKLVLEVTPFDIRAALDDVLSLFSEKTRHKGIELAVFVADNVPELVMGDPGRFRQILTNLVGNALKFTESGHVYVNVRAATMDTTIDGNSDGRNGCASVDTDVLTVRRQFHSLSGFEVAGNLSCGDMLKRLVSEERLQCNASPAINVVNNETCDAVTLIVSVEDTGTGIPIRAQDRIFMPFEQADNSTSRHYEGTGIGLCITKSLVERMGGEINFISQAGVGTTFFFSAVFKNCHRNAFHRSEKKHPEVLPSNLKGFHAVIVDFKPVRAAVTKYHLKRLGMIAEIASTSKLSPGYLCQNGSFTSRTKRPLDVILVEKDAWLGCSKSWPQDWNRSENASTSPKMILLATDITHGDMERARKAGFSDTIIMKPLRASKIAACLIHVLNVGKTMNPVKDVHSGFFLQRLLTGKKILVVDDNKVNRKVVEGLLKKYGAVVECAASGISALELLELPHSFDACFMDIQMPEMDGFETTRRIRELERRRTEDGKPRLPIVAMTADVIHATYDSCLSCGMDGYVSKPFEEESLYHAVAKFFKPNS